MRFKTTTFISVLLFILVVQSCKKDNNSDPDKSASDVSIDITGSIVGENGTYISNAMIELHGQTAMSDEQGVFRLKDVLVSKGRNYLEVNKDGYFFGGRNFYVEDSEPVRVMVKLLERQLIGTISASTGGTAETTDGLKVKLPAGAISGGYSGDINVYGKYMDPTDPETILSIPGMEGQNLAGDDGLLLSFGMGQIELEDGSGNELKLANEMTAEITMPIPNELLASAESTIPLWYFDETKGIWIEEGEAQIQGDKYVGSVEHFSAWNCDDFTCGFYQDIQVTCPKTDMEGIIVRLDIKGRNFPTTTAVNSATGRIRVFIPCSEEIELTVILPASQTAPSTEYFLGSISTGEEASAEPVVVNIDCPNFTTVSGCAVDAEGNPITNGYMYLQFDDFRGAPVYFDNNGCFTATIFDFVGEASKARLIAWNLDDFTSIEGPPTSFNSQVNELSTPLVFGGGSSANPEGRLYVGGENDLFYCLDASNGDLIWTYFREGNYGSNSALVWNNRVYVGNSKGEFYCLNAIDGSLIWEYSVGSKWLNSPVIADTVVYVSHQDGNIFAFDALTGDFRWIQWLPGGGSSSPTVSGDILYIGTGIGNKLTALNKNTGDVLWEYTVDDEVQSSPCVVDSQVFFSSYDQAIYALNATTGSLNWKKTVDTGTRFFSSPTTNNGILFQKSENFLNALNMDNGNIVWQLDNVSDLYSQVEAANGRLYAFMGNTEETLGIRCYNYQNGELVWEKPWLNRPNDYIVANGVIYHSGESRPETMVARDANTGQVLWISNVQGDLTAAPVLVDQNGDVHYSAGSGMRQ